MEVVKGESVKVFGIHWNRVEDYLQINGVDFFNLKIPPTKREVLRIIARIFDPLGLVTPVTYYEKMFLQDLWKEGLSWDQPLPQHFLDRWNEVIQKLNAISTLTLLGLQMMVMLSFLYFVMHQKHHMLQQFIFMLKVIILLK